jgi:hypothetical protein
VRAAWLGVFGDRDSFSCFGSMGRGEGITPLRGNSLASEFEGDSGFKVSQPT